MIATVVLTCLGTPQGFGSGVVFDTSRDVVTKARVVAGGAPLLHVTDSCGHTDPAAPVGSFAPDELAVVRAHIKRDGSHQTAKVTLRQYLGGP
jgi:S1-C subfamily serine protease